MTDVTPADPATEYEPEPVFDEDAPPPAPVGHASGETDDREPPAEAGDPSI